MEICEGLVERDGAMLGVVEDEGLRHMRDGVMQATLRQSRRLVGLDMCRHVSADAAISTERPVAVEDRHAARLEPSYPAVGEFPRVDEVAIGLPRLDRGDRHLAHLRIDRYAWRLGQAPAEGLRGRNAERGLVVLREISNALMLIGLPEVIRSDLEQLAEPSFALAERALGLDLCGDVLGYAAIAAEFAVLAEHRNAAGSEMHEPAVGTGKGVDEIAVPHPRLDGGERLHARFGIDLGQRNIVEALPQQFRGRDSGRRLEAG